MTDGGPATPPPLSWPIVAIICLSGAALYGAFAAGLFAPEGTELFGRFIYNYYFLSLAEGRLDVPIRVVSLEGHYDPDGRAFIYHGLAPVLTRMVMAPVLDLREVPLAGASIWFWASLGSTVYFITAMAILRRFGPSRPDQARALALPMGMAVWLAGPGLVLSANGTLYNEAIAIGFFCAAVWIGAALRVALLDRPPGPALIVMALAAGLAVHARVPMAVGLYAGCGAMALWALWRDRRRALPAVALATVILGAAGVGFLTMNALRFGDPLQVSGANTADGEGVVYGFAYWGVNPPGADQLDAFLRDGTFAIERVLPNLFLYLVDVPKTALSDQILALYRSWTVERGMIRVETPRVGMLWLWAPWAALAIVAAVTGRAGLAGAPRAVPTVALLAGTGIAAGLILAYGTITLRYRVDLWPFMAAVGMLAWARVVAAASTRGTGLAGLAPATALLLSGSLAIGMILSLATAVSYSKKSAEVGIFSFWDQQTCERMVREKGFQDADIAQLCAL